MSRLQKLQGLWDVDPSDPDVAYMIAQEHASAGDYAGAVSWYDRCLDLDPEYHYAYFHRARALEAIGRTDDAAATLRDGLERARDAGHRKATEEIAAYLESLG